MSHSSPKIFVGRIPADVELTAQHRSDCLQAKGWKGSLLRQFVHVFLVQVLLLSTYIFSVPTVSYSQARLGDTVVPVEIEEGGLPPVVAQYESSPKSTHHYYTHADLNNWPNALPADSLELTVTPEPQPAYCAPHEVLNGTLYTRFALGVHDFTFGETDLLDPFTVTVQVQGWSQGQTVGSPYECSLSLTTLQPEQVCQFDVSDQLGSVEYFKVQVMSYSFPAVTRITDVSNPANQATTHQYLLDSLRLHVYYKEKVSVGAYKKDGSDPQQEDLSAPVILELGDVGIDDQTDVWFGILDQELTFTWDLPSECATESYPSYELQILRLFNRDASRYTESSVNEMSIKETVDWDRALSIETGPLLDEDGDQLRSITMTIAEGRGYYLWRVRPIGDRYPGGIANDRNWGSWSESPVDGDELDITGFGSTSATVNSAQMSSEMRKSVFFYSQFDEDPQGNDEERNWMFSRVFTEGEEGTRIHESMSYMTPLLRNRQSQLHMRSEGKAFDQRDDV